MIQLVKHDTIHFQLVAHAYVRLKQLLSIATNVGVACCALATGVSAQVPLDIRQSELQRVEDYLVSLSLDDLVIEHLEIETDREVDLKARRELAIRLVNEYAERMMSRQGTIGNQWHEKASQILNAYPELATSSIRIAMFQSEYLQNEKLFRDWWATGRSPAKRTILIEQWRDLNRELQSLNQRLNSNYEDKVAAIQASPDYQDLQTHQLRRIEGQILHTEYLIGWSAYFQGILLPEQRSDWMAMSDRHFRSFLQVEPTKTLTEIAPEWFDFSSEWNARALVGLGMCHRALNHPQQSQYCFKLIGDHSKNQQTRNLRYVWELNSRVYLDEVSAALELAQQIGEGKNLSVPGRYAFSQATLMASLAMKDRAPVVAKRMLDLGLAGLARQSRVEDLKDFVAKHELSLEPNDFVTQWVKGLLSLHEAERGDATGLETARAVLISAKAAVSESTNPNDVVRCDFLLAKILYQERRFDEAATALAKSSNQLESASPELSAEAQWLAVRSLAQLSQSNSRNLIKANRAIDSLMRRFPGSTYAKRAEFEKIRINVMHLPADQAIERLSRFTSNSPSFALARHEIVRVRYQDWLDAKRENSTNLPVALEALVDSESQYLSITGTSYESRLKAQLLVVDAMLRGDISNDSRSKEIERRLVAASGFAGNADRLDPSVLQELKYYQFLFAAAKHDQVSASALAQWLMKNAKGSRFEKSALIQLAQMADQKLRSSPSPNRDELTETTRIFEQLTRLFVAKDASIKAANARVAFLRLAELKLMLGEVEDSLEIAKRLNQDFPNHKMILRQLANSLMASGRHSEAVQVWQRLIRGVDAGSEIWFESKYNLAVCLIEVGARDQAKKLHAQTIRLSPEIPPQWTQRFEELSHALEPKK